MDPDGLIEQTLQRIDVEGTPADRALKATLRANPWLDRSGRARVAVGVHGVRCHLARLRYRLTRLNIAVDERSLWAAYRVDQLGEAVPQLDRWDTVPWPTDPVDRLAIERSLPRWWAARLLEAYGPDGADRLGAALARPGPITVRARRKGRTAESARAALAARLRAEETQPSRPTRWASAGLHLVDRRPDIRVSPSYLRGDFEVQDEGSQLVVEAVDAQPGMRVLDLCAGSGGKTLALADAMDEDGQLVSADVSAARLGDLRGRARKRRVAVEIVVLDPKCSLTERLHPVFDRILVDAPCSSLGTLRRGPDRKWRVDEADLCSLADRQLKLLEQAARLLVPGGRLVYATCTLATEENHPVVDRLLASAPELLPAAVLPGQGPRLELRPDLHDTDGFFVAGFRRRPALGSPTRPRGASSEGGGIW